MTSVNWSRYAQVYDLMAELNPEYQAIGYRLREFLVSNLAGPIERILDVGAGTGNFSKLAAQVHPEAIVTHLEPDQGMNQWAREKLRNAKISNVEVAERGIDEIDFPEGTFDAIVCVHALYTFPSPRRQLQRLARWLRPGGVTFLCDLGRPLDVGGWRRYLLTHLYATRGLSYAMQMAWSGRDIARQNHRIARLQRNGTYWLHSPEEFREAVLSAGLFCLDQRCVYRGDSDLIVALR